jgi:uncharacterized membrane protein
VPVPKRHLVASILLLASACAHRGAGASEPTALGPHPCTRVAPDERRTCLAAHGALLFAIGNEPGWTLVVLPDAFVLELDYGERRLRGRVLDRSSVEDTTRFVGASDDGASVAIEVVHRRCHDVMSGAPYPEEVVVTLPDSVARGCGFFVGE